MRMLVALISGSLFGLGLVVSDMVNPARILGFLDLAAIPTGGWDPTLAFVFGGALIPMAIAWRIKGGRAAPSRGEDPAAAPAAAPAMSVLDPRLFAGAAVFGVGWGLVGFCPGPALAALGTGSAEALIFTIAMLVGMLGYRFTAGQPRPA